MTGQNPTQDSTVALTYPLGGGYPTSTIAGTDRWNNEHDDASRHLDERILIVKDEVSSSTSRDAWYSTMYSLFEESFKSTVAQLPLVQEHERLAFTIEKLVREHDPSENLFKLRRLTGYSTEQLASLLTVSRETVEHWLRGGEVPRDDVSHINKVLSVVQFSDRGTAEDNARALEDDSLGEVTPFEAIKSHRYTEAMRWLSFSPVRSKKMEREKSVWGNAIGEFQPMLFHDEADGTET